MADAAGLTGGELNAAVTKALVKIQSAQLGRGPANASTFHHGNLLVTLMTTSSATPRTTSDNGQHTA